MILLSLPISTHPPQSNPFGKKKKFWSSIMLKNCLKKIMSEPIWGMCEELWLNQKFWQSHRKSVEMWAEGEGSSVGMGLRNVGLKPMSCWTEMDSGSAWKMSLMWGIKQQSNAALSAAVWRQSSASLAIKMGHFLFAGVSVIVSNFPVVTCAP